MAKKSSKAISAEEAQLETVLNHIRRQSVTIALPVALRKRIAARLSMPEREMYASKPAVYDVIEFSLAVLICQSLSEARVDRLLTGFVSLWLRNCSVMKRGCSEHDAYHALVELSTAEGILQLLQRHRLPAARALAVKLRANPGDPHQTATQHQREDRRPVRR